MWALNDDIQILNCLRMQWDIDLKRIASPSEEARWSCNIRSLSNQQQEGSGSGSSALAAIYAAMEDAGVNFNIY